MALSCAGTVAPQLVVIFLVSFAINTAMSESPEMAE